MPPEPPAPPGGETDGGGGRPATPQAASAAASRAAFPLLLALAAFCGGALRFPALSAAYPYLGYVDEGHVLHPVLATVREGRWEPAQNNYPALPIHVIGMVARAVSPLVPGLDWRLSPRAAVGSRYYYDVVDPPELILAGRALSLLLSLAIVLACGLLGARLAGRVAGLVAALATALLPALVARGSFVMVDLYSTLFVVLACLSASAVERPAQLARIVGAGACAGFAAVSKYPAGLVGVAVLATFALAPWPRRDRWRAMALAAAAGLLGAVLGMPAVLRDPQGVWERMRWQAREYGRATPTYWEQAFQAGEWLVPMEGPELGVPFALAAAAGLGVLLARERSRRPVLAQLLFALLLVAVQVGFAFQAFRNLLPVAALSCVWAGGGAGWLAHRARRPWLVGAGAVTLLALLFLPADLRFARGRAALVDSRREALDWLAAQGGKGRVLVQAEAAFHPHELARLPRARAARLSRLAAAASRGAPRWLVLADLHRRGKGPYATAEQLAAIERRYQPRASFGRQACYVRPGFWRGNALRVTVWERRPGARARPIPSRSERAAPR